MRFKIHNSDPLHNKNQWTWSPEFRRMVGFGREDFTGFPNTVNAWTDRLHPDDSEEVFDRFQECLADRTGKTS